MFTYIMTHLRSEDGASGVEYGILVAAIAALIVALAFLIGTEIQAAFQTVYDAIVNG
jgi:pilus assembly protein Flp/PilA